MKHIPNDFIFHATTTEEAAVLLNSNIEHGLTIENANERLEQFGRNAITETKSITPFQ